MPNPPPKVSKHADDDATPRVPEKSLIAAILARAIMDTMCAEHVVRTDACDWLFNKRRVNQIYSCAYICDALGLDISVMRKFVRTKIADANVRYKFARVRRSSTLTERRL